MHLSSSNNCLQVRKAIAVIGQGVVGLSASLAIKQSFPNANLTIITDRPFEETCSFGPAGIFKFEEKALRGYAKLSFENFAEIERTYCPTETGVKLLYGHIQSDSFDELKNMEECMGDIVYGFRWLTDREMKLLFQSPAKYCVQFGTYAAEGRRYVPWLRAQLQKFDGVEFRHLKIESLKQLVTEVKAANGDAFDAVVNCAGLKGGLLAGDDDGVYPNRGIGFEIKAPWHKHFNYYGPSSFTIPMVDSVMLGTVKQAHRSDTVITDADRQQIWDAYLKLHPAFAAAKGNVVSEFIALRPARNNGLRLESTKIEYDQVRDATDESLKKEALVVHNYGHGACGITLSWGCALETAKILRSFFEI